MTPKTVATIRAARAAAAQREANEKSKAAATLRPRTGKRTAEAIAALQSLRRDISVGVPAASLIDRIDDVLYRLTKGPTK